MNIQIQSLTKPEVLLKINNGAVPDVNLLDLARYSNFIYIERVIVSAGARRLGLAAELYRRVEQVAGEKELAIATEVYSEPPNIAGFVALLRRVVQPIRASLLHEAGSYNQTYFGGVLT